MGDQLKKAEKTAVDAGQAMVKLVDFSASVMIELGKSVASGVGMRLTRSSVIRYSLSDPFIVHRFTQGKGMGDVMIQRYIFASFVLPFTLARKAGGGRLLPFMMASLVNDEKRPPRIIYGALLDIQGRERSTDLLVEMYMLWLNEGLDAIKKKCSKEPAGGWSITHELPARAESEILSAFVKFDEMPLLDIDRTSLPARASIIVNWFTRVLSLLDDDKKGGAIPASQSPKPKR